MFDRDRTVTVASRIVPGYSREGVRVGAVTVRPEVSTSLFLTDNLYATQDDRVSDAAILIGPAVSAQLQDSLTTLTLAADAQVARYFSRQTENNVQFSLSGRGRHTLGGGFWLGSTVSYRHQNERRSDPGAINTSIEPIQFDALDTRGEFGWERGRIRVSAGAGGGLFRFQDGRLADGRTLFQGYRDRDIVRGDLTADYALTADLAIRLQGGYLRNNYKPSNLVSFDRSSDRYELLAGATFEFTDLLRGEIGLGYTSQHYDSPVFRDFSGFGGRIQLEYLPTELTTFTLRASRTIEEAGLPQSPSFFSTAITLSVDHELYRNVIVSGYVGYSSNKFQQPSRSDRRPAVGASATYRLSNVVQVFGRYDFLDVTSSPADRGRSLRINSATVGINIGI